MNNTIILVSCVAAKAAQACPAKDLYLSPLFKMSRRYAEAQGGRWFILSAWWGLLDPEAIIGPYELTLNNMPADKRKQWGRYVVSQLDQVPGAKEAKIIFLAGAKYREPLTAWVGNRGTVPMEGLRIGEQLSWLKQRM